MKSALLLDVVIRKSATILKLLSGENEALLIRWDALLVLNLRLDIVDRVARFDFQRYGLTSKSLDENLHSTTETKNCRTWVRL